MPTRRSGVLLRYIRRLTADQADASWSDRELLHRFAAGQEAAFNTLVRRHGPLVLGVCRRVLHHEQDAEDAFQATFLILARKAAARLEGIDRQLPVPAAAPRPRTKELAAATLDELWDALARDDAAKAHTAIWTLAASP
jgi:hypothetical protein